jgi:hypothetical protein
MGDAIKKAAFGPLFLSHNWMRRLLSGNAADFTAR